MRIRNIAVIVVAVALCICSEIIAYGLVLQADTRNMIEASDMVSLRTLDEVSAKVGNLKLSGCKGAHCVYDVAVNNRLFSRLHLANFTELRATYYFDHGTRILSVVDYRIAIPRGNSPVVHVQDDGQADELWNELFGVNPHGHARMNRGTEQWSSTRERPKPSAELLGLSICAVLCRLIAVRTLATCFRQSGRVIPIAASGPSSERQVMQLGSGSETNSA